MKGSDRFDNKAPTVEVLCTARRYSQVQSDYGTIYLQTSATSTRHFQIGILEDQPVYGQLADKPTR